MKKRTECPVCNLTLDDWTPNVDGRDHELFDCPMCGDFITTLECVEDLPAIHRDDTERRLRISHAIRTMGRQKVRQFLHSDLAEQFSRMPLPKPREQADNLIRWLGASVGHLGEYLDLVPGRMKSICGTHADDGFHLIMENLIRTGLVFGVGPDGTGTWTSVTLTFAGWDQYESLIRGRGAHGRGFMAMKFGDENLNKVFEAEFVPKAAEAGFELRRIIDEPKAGLIDNRMRVEIQNAVFLVADLTHGNPGAYWEAGYAEGLGKPVFFTCEKSKFDKDKSHFDTNHQYTIVWDAAEPGRAGDELKLAIRATLPHLAKMKD